MKAARFSIQYASPPDRKEVVAEIWIEDEQCGELSHDEGQLLLEVYPRPSGGLGDFRQNNSSRRLPKPRKGY